MIRLYEQNVLPVASNNGWVWEGLGLGVISDAISCTVEEERNGKYELTMEYPVNGQRYSDLVINRTLVVQPNHRSDPQGFRIYQISKSMERVITVKGEHISYQLSHVPVLPLQADSCANAMAALFNSSNQTEECPFVGTTDKAANYSDGSSGKVVTQDFQGRALEFAWTVTDVASNRISINWTLKGVGKLTGYNNGWVMCGPVKITVGRQSGSSSAAVIFEGFQQGNRVQLYENQIIASSSEPKNVYFVSGTTSLPVQVEAYLYYDHPEGSTSKQGLVTGSGAITPKGTETADTSGIGEFKIDVPTSLRSALGGQDGSVLDVYGGEFEWDNLTVRLLAHRGTDRGVYIRYGKNLTSLEQEETIDQTYTGIVPYWKGTEPETDATVIVTLTHILVNGQPLPNIPAEATSDAIHSANASNFPYQRTLPKDFTDVFSDWDMDTDNADRTRAESFWDKVPMPDDLKAVAEAWVEAGELGVPEVNLNVSFVALSETTEYQNLAIREEVALCDTVHVIFEELGVQADAKVVKTKYDCLLNRYESIDLSSTGKLKAT